MGRRRLVQAELSLKIPKRIGTKAPEPQYIDNCPICGCLRYLALGEPWCPSCPRVGRMQEANSTAD